MNWTRLSWVDQINFNIIVIYYIVQISKFKNAKLHACENFKTKHILNIKELLLLY